MPMKEEKILQATGIYRAKFKELQVVPEQSDTDTLARAAWCAEQIPAFLAEGRREKVMRWLGFVQGVLFATRVFSVEELKNHVRPDEVL